MLDRIKVMLYTASAAAAAGSFMVGAALAAVKVRRAKTHEELLDAVKRMGRQGDKTAWVKSSDRRLQELNLSHAKLRIKNYRTLFETLEVHAKKDGQQAQSHAVRVKNTLNDLEAELSKWSTAIDHTGSLCDAASWATRFLAAYAADAALNPGSYGGATRALAVRVVDDFQKYRRAAVVSGAKGKPGGIDPLLMEILSDAAPAAVKVSAWSENENSPLAEDAGRAWAQKAKSFIDDRTRIIRTKASEPEVARRDAKRTEMELRGECAQIFWMAGLLDDAKDELTRGSGVSGSKAAERLFGLVPAGAPLSGQAVAGFNAWAIRSLGLGLKPKT